MAQFHQFGIGLGIVPFNGALIAWEAGDHSTVMRRRRPLQPKLSTTARQIFTALALSDLGNTDPVFLEGFLIGDGYLGNQIGIGH